MIRFRCECGKKLKAEPEIVGRRVKCTRCDNVHRVPESDDLSPKIHLLGSDESDADSISMLVKPSKSAAQTVGTSGADETLNDDFAVLHNSDLSDGSDSDTGFDFDINDIDLKGPNVAVEKESSREESETEVAIDTGFAPQFKTKVKSHKGKLQLLAIGLVVLVAVGGIGYVASSLFSSAPSYPVSFESMQEVKFYRQAIAKTEKSHRTLTIISNAYIASKTPSADVVKTIKDYNKEIEQLTDADSTLKKAYEMIENEDENQARKLLVTTAKALIAKVPTIDAETMKYQQMSR